ncbi:hypothetical protein [Alkalicoccus halolimnae]|uniref:Uncharacterized protein n=1 Tax=Alkalicoccus halolimnae TaxID=1667239 RepID=A0A5C7FAW4_9BACI|nr:hypothetical protein [Alkalicoccus halolimnae]TXF87273.1 hypothetical protein FTX54_00685 [Alkalicoccus halolimnae]
MLNKLLPAGVIAFFFLTVPSAVVFAAENGNGNGEGGIGFSEIVFTILAFVVLALFIFYMIKDNAK